MILRLYRIELLKVRRSLALMMAFVCPLMVVALNFLIQLKSKHPPPWNMFWMGITGLWSYFMFPLYIALVTALLNGNEHKNSTWRVMLSLPISSNQLYTAKLALAFTFVLLSNIALFAFGALAIQILAWTGISTEGAYQFSFANAITMLTFTCAPVLLFQHWLSWRFANIVAPLTSGVVGAMGIMQIGQSKDWIYYPWSYTMMAMNGSKPEMREQAILLTVFVGAALLLASYFWLVRTKHEFR
ncbi:ABC transporter permease [Undibacterium cyanobacteriorum]|uniref:ABC transporter permease n=1 Tax=Undibacterium cyanobacteriorum TaxID=3073561 RepID=A0ABY9RPM3_9BURK|nr:ABC transporter permease [Undibacterium sp. 20NA77.5]WMW82392.1 ABC transporter permease [Undibacterium sp. 20NA77.5]